MDNQEHEVEITEKNKRKPFPGWLYGVLFVLFDAIGVGIIEWGVTATSRVKLSSPTIGWGFVSKMWTDLNFVAVLNLLLCGAVLLPGVQSANLCVYLPLSPGRLLLCCGAVFAVLRGVLFCFGRAGTRCFAAVLELEGRQVQIAEGC